MLKTKNNPGGLPINVSVRAGAVADRYHVQGAAFALGTGSTECELLRLAQQFAAVRGGGVEMDPAQGEGLAPVAVGKQSEVADLDKACGQDVEQEAADELDRVEGHDGAAENSATDISTTIST
jgi:hypothetical protein